MSAFFVSLSMKQIEYFGMSKKEYTISNFPLKKKKSQSLEYLPLHSGIKPIKKRKNPFFDL